MKQVSLAEIILAITFVVVSWTIIGVGSFVYGRYYERGQISLPDSSTTITLVPQVPVSGTAKPVKKPRLTPTAQPSIVHIYVNSPDSVIIARADLDSLKAERTWEIENEQIGKLTIWHLPTLHPSAEFPSYYHESPPLQIKTIEIVREREPAWTEKAEWGLYGAGVAAVLILVLR